MEIISDVLESLIKQKEWSIDNFEEGIGSYTYDIEDVILGAIENFKKDKKLLTKVNKHKHGTFYSTRILEYQEALREYREKKKQIESQFGNKRSTERATARQSTLAIYYMQKSQAFPRKTGIKKQDAEFIRFLTGHNLDVIRKLLGNPLKRPDEKTGKATQELIKDLTIVLNQFESIQFKKGEELVENDINKLQNDLNTFN